MTHHLMVSATRLSLSTHPYIKFVRTLKNFFRTYSSQLAYKLSVVSIGLEKVGIKGNVYCSLTFHFPPIPHIYAFLLASKISLTTTSPHIESQSRHTLVHYFKPNFTFCMEIRDFIRIGELNLTNHNFTH